MKLYNKVGKVINADKSQLEVLLNAGWSRTKKSNKVMDNDNDQSPVTKKSNTIRKKK